MAPLESKLRSAIIKALSNYSGVWFVVHQSGTQERGMPDIIGCYAGKFFGLEVKRPGHEHEITARQALVLKKIRGAGGRAGIITSVQEALDFVFGTPP